MDATLRCNKPNGGCRASLSEKAVVTTCCHIFCLRCADELGLTRAAADERTCPACTQHLPNTDDAVTTVLQPTEDYKTSVLSGLDPTTIMECAGRALAFWSYQTASEIAYQEHLGKIMTDKYTHLSRSLDKVINEANTEIQCLQQKVMNNGVDYNTLKQKNHELVELYKEKNRKHQQTQHLYDTLKKKCMAKNVHTAATENVRQTLQTINSQARPDTYHGNPQTNVPNTGNYQRRSQITQIDSGVEQLHTHQRSGSSNHGSDVGGMPPPQIRQKDTTTGTPTHRAPLGQPLGSIRGHINRSQIPTTAQRKSYGYSTDYPGSTQRTSSTMQQQFPGPSGRSTSGNYSIQAGMKIGTVPARGGFVQRPASFAGDSFSTNGLQTGAYSRSQLTGANSSYLG